MTGIPAAVEAIAGYPRSLLSGAFGDRDAFGRLRMSLPRGLISSKQIAHGQLRVWDEAQERRGGVILWLALVARRLLSARG